MSRPIRDFLSHEHGDRPAVVRLETDMRRRGLWSWRDRKDQHHGVATDPAILNAIKVDTDGFVISEPSAPPRVLGSVDRSTREW